MRKDTIAALARAIARELAPDLLDMIREAASGVVIANTHHIAVPSAQTILRYGELTIDTVRHEVTLLGRTIPLKPREFALLVSLARHPGQVLTRDLLLELAWPVDAIDAIDNNRTVDVHVRRIRTRLGSASSRIKTVFGVGYKFDDK
jgi:DNA-binding response OmpR family regulator